MNYIFFRNKLQDTFIEKWVEYMNKSVEMKEINEKWLPNYYAEDRPISLMGYLDMEKIQGLRILILFGNIMVLLFAKLKNYRSNLFLRF